MKGDKKMKAVLISIQPKWCDLIANGKKTFEIRKTKPKIETPFKCYIYCTKPKGKFDFGLCIDNESFGLIAKCNYNYAQEHEMPILSGKVIGEFICDEIITDKTLGHDAMLMTAACLSPADAAAYCTKDTYGWHISELVIYNKPKELSEFKKINRDCWYADLGLAKRDCPECRNEECFLLRSPQSWCYVEVAE